LGERISELGLCESYKLPRKESFSCRAAWQAQTLWAFCELSVVKEKFMN